MKNHPTRPTLLGINAGDRPIRIAQLGTKGATQGRRVGALACLYQGAVPGSYGQRLRYRKVGARRVASGPTTCR